MSYEGLMVVHYFCAHTCATNLSSVQDAVARVVDEGGQVVAIAVLGDSADMCFMCLHEDAWVLRDFQTALKLAGMEIVRSYVSITELSEYALDLPPKVAAMRLHPTLPPTGKRAWCFYPMSKRRNPGQNWYELSFDERRELLREHGESGRKFAGRIFQLITASTGLDYWEWGVTLFGSSLDDIKETVYTMRYDRASSVYAEFGTFTVGLVGETSDILLRTNWCGDS